MSELQAHLDRAGQAFRDAFHTEPEVLGYAPGRINVIGEHTDYNGGLALPSAIDRWVVVALRAQDGPVLRAHSADLAGRWEWDTRTPPPSSPTWTRYVAGALSVCGQQGRGAQVLLAGDVPMGAGLSSSAALEVALLNGLRALFQLDFDDRELIRRGQRIEHEHLGLHSGLLDQVASQFSRPGHLLRVDFRDLSWQAVPVSMPDWCWVVIDSGVRRELAGSAYQQRVLECREGLRWLSAQHAAVQHFRDVTLELLEQAPAEPWRDRLHHVVTENARVDQVVRALAVPDWPAVGAALTASHASLRERYQVSCVELDLLVQLALDAGALGARMVGGGFGGCTLNLVPRAHALAFGQRVVEHYQARTSRVGRAWSFTSVGGAGVRGPAGPS